MYGKKYIRYKGMSSDCRTNRWSITCPYCNYVWEPTTTLHARSVVTCEKCQKGYSINYNDQAMSEIGE